MTVIISRCMLVNIQHMVVHHRFVMFSYLLPGNFVPVFLCVTSKQKQNSSVGLPLTCVNNTDIIGKLTFTFAADSK